MSFYNSFFQRIPDQSEDFFFHFNPFKRTRNFSQRTTNAVSKTYIKIIYRGEWLLNRLQ